MSDMRKHEYSFCSKRSIFSGQHNGKVIIGTSAFLLIITLSFIFAISKIFPSKDSTNRFLTSVNHLELLSKQKQNPLEHHLEILKTIDDIYTNLTDISDSFTNDPDLIKLTKKINDSLISLKAVKMNITVSLSPNEYDEAVKKVIEESKELEKSIENLPFISGEVIIESALKFIWISLAICFLIYLFVSPSAIRIISFLLPMFRSFKGFGLELAFNDEDKKNKEIHSTFKTIFTEFRQEAKNELDRFTKTSGLNDEFKPIAKNIRKHINELTNKDLKDFRCTIHAQDMLFHEFLCQILDYNPRGKGQGRAWSVFYGIIGRVWRSAKEDELFLKNTVSNDENEAVKVITSYGMTCEQLENTAEGKRSFLATPILDDNDDNNDKILGVFYMDSSESFAFKINEDDKDTVKEIHNYITNSLNPLIPLLKQYRKKFVLKGPDIQILGA